MPVPILNTSNPVNRAHPLAYGLVNWWKPLPHNWGGSVLYDTVGKNNASKVGSATQWNGENVLRGTRSISGWTTSAYYGFTSQVSFTGDYSIVIWWKSSSFSDYSFAASGSSAAVFGLNSGGAGFYVRTHNSGSAYTPSVSGATLGVWQQAVLSAKYNSTSYCYLDNVKSSSFANDFGTGSWNYIGYYSSWSFLGSIAEVKFYNRILSDSEVIQLRSEALQGYPNLLNWHTPRAWSFGSAVQGGGGGFKPAWAVNRSGILGGLGS